MSETWINDPEAITRASFQFLDTMLASYNIAPAVYPIVRRVVHASADFEFAEGLRFHPQAIAAGIDALRAGAPIFCDTQMVASGIRKASLAKLTSPVICRIDDPAVREEAQRRNETRAMIALRQVAATLDGGIIVIGNAPTALIEALNLCAGESKNPLRPALIVGIPVGFIGTLESKRLLIAQENIPYISNETYKGGSAVAAAIINALLLLATGEGS